jgi:hypothetical protein
LSSTCTHDTLSAASRAEANNKTWMVKALAVLLVLIIIGFRYKVSAVLTARNDRRDNGFAKQGWGSPVHGTAKGESITSHPIGSTNEGILVAS